MNLSFKTPNAKKKHKILFETINFDNVDQQDLQHLLDNINKWDIFETSQYQFPPLFSMRSITPNKRTFHSIEINKPKKYSLIKTNENE